MMILRLHSQERFRLLTSCDAMAKATAERCAKDLKSSQADREILAARHSFASPARNENFYEASDQFVYWDFYNTNIPSLHDRFDDLMIFVPAKSNPGTIGNRDISNADIDNGSRKSFLVGMKSKPSDERHSPLSPSDEAVIATQDKHDLVHSPWLR